jgi:microcystin-dependent protein
MVDTQYLGEIRLMAFDFAPRGWEACDGKLLPINAQTKALFNMVGTIYGGDGTTTFGVPDLRGAAAVHRGAYQQGQRGGVPNVLLGWPEIEAPGHTHPPQASADPADSPLAADRVLATATVNMYAPYDPATLVTLPAETVQSVGGVPHENMAPYQAVMFCIATTGLQPGPGEEE